MGKVKVLQIKQAENIIISKTFKGKRLKKGNNV